MKRKFKQACEHCEEREATHQALVREEVLSDERGTVWGHVNMWLCDECDRESGPDPDLLYDEWRDRQMEERDEF